MLEPDQLRTRKTMVKELAGATWLGNASLDEYCVAEWFQQNAVQYIYQQPIPGFKLMFNVDFRVLKTSPSLVIEVQGDKWHAGRAQIAVDRQRVLAVKAQGYVVVQVWGNDIYAYPGYPVPTQAHFDQVMRAAIEGREIGKPM